MHLLCGKNAVEEVVPAPSEPQEGFVSLLTLLSFVARGLSLQSLRREDRGPQSRKISPVAPVKALKWAAWSHDQQSHPTQQPGHACVARSPKQLLTLGFSRYELSA